MAKSKKSGISIGCLFWVALILFFVVLFLFNKKNIESFIDQYKTLTNKKDTQTELSVKTDVETNTKPEVLPKNEEVIVTPKTEPKPVELPKTEEKPSQTTNKKPTQDSTKPVEKKPPVTQPTPDPTVRNLRKSVLYYIYLDANHAIKLKGITRLIDYKDSPLTQTMLTLISGPTPSELNEGLLSMIPSNSKILSIQVKNGVAYINFNEEFQFNSFGQEGLKAQLRQIVFTATEFASVDSVQILIGGKVQPFLGQEGVNIGTPLTRNSF